MTNPVTLPAGTTIGKSFEYGLDVNLGTYGSPSWQPVRRISGFNPTDTPTTQDAQTYDDQGAPNADVTGWGFAIAFNVQVNRSLTTGLYLPEVEALLARTRPSATGELATIDTRWYHKPATGTPNPNDAGRGLANVAKTRQNTGPGGEIELFGFTLTGKGAYEEIPNPFTGWGSTVPLIAAVTPPAAEVGDLVTISGSGFLGATALTIDGVSVPAEEFLVINSATIVAAVPTGVSGAAPVIVTTPGGASSAFAYVAA